ncbi:MAG: conjugal transfer protein TrbJ, partial [Caulobacter sp. 12-67-6]
MRRQLLAAAAIVAVSLGLGPLPPQPAAAQQIVFDPRAVAQAVQQVRQGLAQIQQLQAQVTNQVAMLQR